MNCTVVYGFGSNLKYRAAIPVVDAFRKLKDGWFIGYAFVNIYYRNRLVYTTQGVAGYRYICDDCPYCDKGGKKK